MSSTKRIANVGQSVRADDFSGAANAAAAADDRALEILCTPGSVQKKIEPLSEETAALNPRLLVVGKDTDAAIANGVVRLRPCYLAAGVSGDPNKIGLAAKRGTNLDSAVFGNNSSGSTRFDLLYATISYGTLTQETVRQKPLTGGAPVSTLLTTQADMLVTLSIVPAVASGNPLASLPADAVDGSSYNFGLAMVSVANGFSSAAINQSSITPLWSGGWVQGHRVRGYRPMSNYVNGGTEKSTTASLMSERNGSFQRFFLDFRSKTSFPTASPGVVLDNSIDWRTRLLLVQALYYTGALFAVTAAGGGILQLPTTSWIFTGPGNAGTTFAVWNSGQIINLNVDTSGVLRAWRAGTAPADGTNGDFVALVIDVLDQFVA